jgi:hypothetical protein
VLVSCVAVQSGIEAQESSPQALAKPAEPNAEHELEPMGLEFEGLLPGTIDTTLNGSFEIEFRIYLSPQGGDAVWKETRTVEVRRGRIDLLLGERNPIPWEIHEATFKFLGAAVNGKREVYPRFAIVNVVYVSPKEALLAPAEPGSSPADERGADYGSRATVENATEEACSWREAAKRARAHGGELPSYRDWYRALETCDETRLAERSGHYEWVRPWVYDTSSHGRYNAFFRGRFQGCDYMDLSPEKHYAWRISRTPEPAKDAAGVRDER